MKSGFKFISCAFAGALSLFAANAHAATIVNLLGDTGNLRNETYAPPSITSITLTTPYGAPPLPTVTVIPNGIALTFTPTSDFMAFASNSSGGKTQTMDGKLDLLITFASPVHMTTNIFEDGIWSTLGIGTKDVTGGVVVSEANNIIPTESHGGIFGAESYNPSGTWSLFNQVSGFAGAFTTYKVSIDNTLIVEALASQTASSAFLAKKDFTVTFTTDGSTGGGPPLPEPASLGILTLGGVALLARRRK